MADELSKKPIKRVTVPTVSKDIPSIEKLSEEKSTIVQNIALFALFLMVSGIVYISIFQKEFLLKYTSSKKIVTTTTIITDSATLDNTDSISYEDVNTIIGQDKITHKTPTKKDADGNVIYPSGTKFYLIAGTYIFYPYAEKCVARMKAAGFNAAIISTGEDHKFHRVYLEASEDGAAVRAKRDELISSQGMKVWVYAE